MAARPGNEFPTNTLSNILRTPDVIYGHLGTAAAVKRKKRHKEIDMDHEKVRTRFATRQFSQRRRRTGIERLHFLT